MTVLGLNMSSQLTDKFRAGARVYDHKLASSASGIPRSTSLNWAVADYRFKNRCRIRAGKVKTTLGLYNDAQDLGFLRVFVMLPQSIHPSDHRDITIAHSGGDVYGNDPLGGRLGDISYPMRPTPEIAATHVERLPVSGGALWRALPQLGMPAVWRRCPMDEPAGRRSVRHG
jgi:hypothetical protein